MSWLFSRALGAAFSAASYSVGEQWVPLSLMPTAHPFLRRGKTTDHLNLFQYGQTCEVLTERHGAELLTWFLAGFRARTYQPPERVRASAESDQASGPSSQESFAKFDRSTHSWRTAQPCLLGEPMSFSETWPRWGSMRNGECSERKSLASHTGGSGCGFSLPTPSGVNGGRNNTMGRIDEWGGSSNPLRGTVIGSMCSAEFEEMVMGWPIGWTEPTPYATDKFREWLSEHGENCMADSRLNPQHLEQCA